MLGNKHQKTTSKFASIRFIFNDIHKTALFKTEIGFRQQEAGAAATAARVGVSVFDIEHVDDFVVDIVVDIVVVIVVVIDIGFFGLG